MKLVIVESPAKAKTIGKILGKEYVVESSIGHIRDLPKTAADIPAKLKAEKWTRLGVNVEKDFEPLYVVPTDKKKQVKKLKDLLKKADELYLATDEDREGESISWHLLEVLQPKKIPIKRLAFHEITKEAIQAALDNPREVDMDLVSAQETRRVLDRLYGYEVSPILWRKVAPKLSAGRVQSVALRIIVERERARMSFKAAQYHSITGDFLTEADEQFEAVLKEYDGKKVAIGKDFNPDTGELIGKNLLQIGKDEAEKMVAELSEMSFVVESVEKKPTKSSPYAPFITSTLQQEANRKLGYSSKQAMQVAQKLYENGYITYMRTDSISLSSEAINAARNLIMDEFGAKYLPEKPRVFKSKVKNAQEAHEAIRPAGNQFKTPKSIRAKLTEEEFKLYDLIYKRTLASQMADAVLQQTVVKVASKDKRALFQANGKVIEFDGYMRAYFEHKDVEEGEENEDPRDVILPVMEKGESTRLKKCHIKGHETKPPARFTEASLVKELEARGIGRPSTYASIIDTILRRNYVFRLGKALVPTFVAFAVIRLLEEHFMSLVDMQFTASMEEDLDAISRGEEESVAYLKSFYYGNKKDHHGLTELVKAEIDARDVCTIPVEGSDGTINIRVGRYGPYLERGEEKASIPDGIEPDKLKLELASELIEMGSKLAENEVLGVHPETGESVYVKVGRFGPYVQLGEGDLDKKIKPKMKSLLKGMDVADVNLETALKIVAMPKELGVFEDNGEKIVADIGRYGPYIKAGSETRSVVAEEILDLSFEKAVEVLRTPKPAGRGGRGRAAASPLKEFDGGIKVLTGRYGPYVTDGKVNASVPKGVEVEELTLEKAQDLIKAKKK